MPSAPTPRTLLIALALVAALVACSGGPPQEAAGDGDIATLPAGEAVNLLDQARAGKLTIYDFYADWCSPCRIVGPRLEALARSRPEEIALRKVDVVNWESDAAVRQGIDFLPYLAVVSPDGRLLAAGSDSYDLLKDRYGLDLVAELRG
jgi:thiol-disulfide isomerase/thioredoxin